MLQPTRAGAERIRTHAEAGFSCFRLVGETQLPSSIPCMAKSWIKAVALPSAAMQRDRHTTSRSKGQASRGVAWPLHRCGKVSHTNHCRTALGAGQPRRKLLFGPPSSALSSDSYDKTFSRQEMTTKRKPVKSCKATGFQQRGRTLLGKRALCLSTDNLLASASGGLAHGSLHTPG